MCKIRVQRPITVSVVDQVPDEFKKARLRKTVEWRSVSGLVAKFSQARPRFAGEPANHLGRRAAPPVDGDLLFSQAVAFGHVF